MDADFLLTRGPDLVVLGVRLHDFIPRPAPSAFAPPVMVAASDAARIVLFFPPQHVLEETFGGVPAIDARAQGLLAGSTRVAYAIRSGTPVPLDTAGILAACRHLAPGPGETDGSTVPPGPLDTRIELPSRMVSTPSATSGPVRPHPPVVSRHAAKEVFGPGGAIGTWLTRLRPSPAEDIATPLTAAATETLALHLVDPELAARLDPGFSLALDRDARTLIVAAAQTKPPRASRLQLSALGGSLTALGDWDGIRWSHRTAVGRDQEVVVVERGLLYPFGLRAVLTIVTVRDPAGSVPAGSLQTPGTATPLPTQVGPVPPGGTLGLRKMTTLELVDTARTSSSGDVMSRTFPFTAVEVTSSRFSGLGSPELGPAFSRPTPALEQLRQRLGVQQEESRQAEEVWRPAADGLTRTLDDLRHAGFPPVAIVDADGATLTPDGRTLTQINTGIAALEELDKANRRALDELGRAQAALDQLLSTTPVPDTGPEDPAIAEARQAVAAAALEVAANPFTADQAQQLNRLRAIAGTVQPQLEAAWRSCEQEMAKPRTVVDVALDVNDPDRAAAAARWLELKPMIDALHQAIELEKAQANPFHLFAWPTSADGRRRRFPVRLHKGDQVVDTTMPMIFVKDFALPADEDTPAYASLTDPELADALDNAWRGTDTLAQARGMPTLVENVAAATAPPAGIVAVSGVLLDVVGAGTPAPADISVVQALHILGPAGRAATGRAVPTAELFTPSLGRAAAGGAAAVWAMSVDLPAVRSLLGTGADALGGIGPPLLPTDVPGVPVTFAEDFLTNGAAADVLFDTVSDLAMDFTTRADRSGGLSALQLKATGIARELGPVQVDGLTSSDPAAVIGASASLLGLPLKELLATVPGPPTIVSQLLDGAQPVVEMSWQGVTLDDLLFFRAHRGEDEARKSLLDLCVRSTLDEVTTDCTLTDFSLVFPDEGTTLVRLDFSSLRYHQRTTHAVAQPPDVEISGFDVELLGPLELLEELQRFASLVGSVPGIRATPRGVTATFVLPVPDLACGAFSLSNIVFRSVVDVPFGGDPVSVTIAFASRDNPFGVSVLTFGGTGYVDIRIDAAGARIEASMDFGARMAVNFLVARGEVHALGGVRYLQRGSSVELTGFIRIGGSVDVLGLVSASIELVVQLGYDSDTRTLAGRAKLVLEIDLTFWSDSVEIDSGLWVLEGGSTPAEQPLPGPVLLDDEIFALVEAEPTEAELAAWRAYRSRFARGGVA